MKATMLSGALAAATAPGHPHVDTDFANQLRTPHIYLSLRQRMAHRQASPADIAMRTRITSDGQRAVNIRFEIAVRRLVYALGVTQLCGPYSGASSTTKGVALSLRSGIDREMVGNDCRTQSAHSRDRRYRAATRGQSTRCRCHRRHGRDEVQSLLAQRKRPTALACPCRVVRFPTRLRTAMAVTYPCVPTPMIATFAAALEVRT